MYLFEFLCFANVRMSSCLAEYKYVMEFFFVMERREIRELKSRAREHHFPVSLIHRGNCININLVKIRDDSFRMESFQFKANTY